MYRGTSDDPAGSHPELTMHHRVTTAFELPGLRVVSNHGIVRGITVRSRSIGGQIGAAFQQLAGGNITLYTKLSEDTRKEAYELMVRHAVELGANAVIGMRYDANELGDGVAEVLCYGTAVTVVPLDQ